MRVPALALAALALLTLGCGLLASPIDPSHGLKDTQKRFVRYLRWGRFREASRFVREESRAEFLETAEALDAVRLTGYEVLSLEIGAEARTATARVRFTGHPVAMPVERSVELVEHWRREEGGAGWRVDVALSRLSQGLRTAAR